MRTPRVVAAAAATVLGAALVAPAVGIGGAAAAPAAGPDGAPPQDTRSYSDNRLLPFQKKAAAIKQAALEKAVRTGSDRSVLRVGDGQYAQVEQSGRDRIFTIIAEFGQTEHSAYCDKGEECTYESDGSTTRNNGPLHNQIPEPDRSTDNSTLWQPNYNRAHYEDMYFNRMKGFYEDQSSGVYTFNGDVTQWVKVPFNQARYGRDFCGDIVCNNTWFLVRDGLAYWVETQLDAGQTMDEITEYLQTFDKQDRYDFDADGDFREADGYIDHLQVVHAGGDQADGDPVYGEDAIWSHRWYAGINPEGTGPEDLGQFGGVEVGEGGVSDPDGANVEIPDNPTGVWAGDYTIQPENGGLGVFAHEYAHDLGLPDLYDTSGNTGGAENSVGFWSLMSQSRGTARQDDGIGDRPSPMGAWDKFQLGWLDYEVARAGRDSEHTLRPGQQVDGRNPNGLIVLLPDKRVQLALGDPCEGCGERYFYSDAGDDLNNTMTREVDGGGPLTAQVRYDIEEGFDFAFLEASDDGGETWEPVETNVSTEDDESGENSSGAGISGSTDGQWVDLTADVPAGTDALRFRYVTDGAAVEDGFQVDQIVLGGEEIGTAETPEGWEFDGFRTTTGSETVEYLNGYFVDNRQFVARDRIMDHVYNFGFASEPDRVEFYGVEPGALISYWDTSYADNNVGDHPGSGQILPVDANPYFTHNPDGTLVRPRTLAYDSTFSLEPSDTLRLHYADEPFRVPGHEAVPVFDDREDYWYGSDEHGSEHEGRYQPGWYGVDVPNTGTQIRVVRVSKSGQMRVNVR